MGIEDRGSVPLEAVLLVAAFLLLTGSAMYASWVPPEETLVPPESAPRVLTNTSKWAEEQMAQNEKAARKIRVRIEGLESEVFQCEVARNACAESLRKLLPE